MLFYGWIGNHWFNQPREDKFHLALTLTFLLSFFLYCSFERKEDQLASIKTTCSRLIQLSYIETLHMYKTWVIKILIFISFLKEKTHCGTSLELLRRSNSDEFHNVFF